MNVNGARTLALIGTSGWHYDAWRGAFYAEDLPRDAWLSYYADHFRTVEVNNSFYQLPKPETLINWCEAVPSDFTFAVKASQYITHMKNLKDPQQSVPAFLERVSVLGKRLGPILFQLPPNWHRNVQRLRSFLDVLPPDYRYVFEFRHPSWFTEQVYETLRAYKVAFCIYDFHDCASPRQVTTDFVYVRLHGTMGKYEGAYSSQALAGWSGAFATWMRQGQGVYCYFNNTKAGHALDNALELQSMLY